MSNATMNGQINAADIAAIKSQAAGQWEHVLSLAGIDSESLDGRNHPCPKCEGKDRFRFINRAAGAVFCNQCFNKENNDGIAAVRWVTGCSFLDAVRFIADAIGYSLPDAGEREEEPGPLTLEEHVAAIAQAKSIEPAELMRFDPELGEWEDRATGYTAHGIRVPIYDPLKKTVCGKFFITADRNPKCPAKLRKGAICKGGTQGMFVPLIDVNGEMRIGYPNPDEPMLLVEGFKDAAALNGLGFNAIGTQGTSFKEEWILAFQSCDVSVVHDLDHAGCKFVARVDRCLQGVANVQAIRLPGQITESGGDDVRDAIRKHGESMVKELILDRMHATGELTVPEFYHGDSFADEPEEPSTPVRNVHQDDFDAGAGSGSEDESLTVIERMEKRGIKPPKEVRQLLDEDIRHTFLIEGMFAEGMTAVIAGASKGMKTSIAIDLSLSLALGNRFLGKFFVPERKRVLIFSVESGEASIKETAERVIKAKGIDSDILTDEIMIHGEWIPQAGNAEDVRDLTDLILLHRSDVVILDPTYFMIDGDNQSNIQKQGQELRQLAKAILDAGATPVFVDHVKLSSNNAREFRPLELSDLSGAGKSAFFRQWLLVSRREKFDENNPVHRLHLTFGGNHGKHGRWGVDIDETRDEQDQRIWDVEVRTADEIRDELEADAEQRIMDREAKKEARRAKQAEQRRNQLRSVFVDAGENGCSKSVAINTARLNGTNGRQAFDELLDREEIEPCEVAYRDGRPGKGYRIVRAR